MVTFGLRFCFIAALWLIGYFPLSMNDSPQVEILSVFAFSLLKVSDNNH